MCTRLVVDHESNHVLFLVLNRRCTETDNLFFCTSSEVLPLTNQGRYIHQGRTYTVLHPCSHIGAVILNCVNKIYFSLHF